LGALGLDLICNYRCQHTAFVSEGGPDSPVLPPAGSLKQVAGWHLQPRETGVGRYGIALTGHAFSFDARLYTTAPQQADGVIVIRREIELSTIDPAWLAIMADAAEERIATPHTI